MAKYRRFKEGQRVVLTAGRREKWKEEHGMVVSAAAGDDMYQVVMDKRLSRDDDGIRRVHASQLKLKPRIKYCNCGHSIAAHNSGRCSECPCPRFLDETKAPVSSTLHT